MDTYKETYKGRRFYPVAPVFDLDEIAHSLSLTCRFSGACKRFYSVAEHSVFVADIMEMLGLGDPREGLLHDGVESVLADIASPIKSLLPDYKRLEKSLDGALRKQFELPEEATEGCKTADWIALCIEAQELMATGGQEWYWPEGIVQKADQVRRLLMLPPTFGQPPSEAEIWFRWSLNKRGFQW